jgi:hypothetical protein
LGPLTRSDACWTDPLVGRSVTVTEQEWPAFSRHAVRELDHPGSPGASRSVTCIASPEAQIRSLRCPDPPGDACTVRWVAESPTGNRCR